MSEAQVLAAAAALRRFCLDEIAALCEEEPTEIRKILAAASPTVRTPDGAGDRSNYEVSDLAELRSMVRVRAGGHTTPRSRRGTAGQRDPVHRAKLAHAEESLLRCGGEPSAAQRRIQVATAVNHLKQVLAQHLQTPWWMLKIADETIDERLRDTVDRGVAARLQLNIAVARLAINHTSGHTVPTSKLVDQFNDFRETVSALGEQRADPAIHGFVDLLTAQLATDAAPVVDRLVVTLARRRIHVAAGHDVEAAMRTLEPLIRTLGSAPNREPVRELYRTVRHLPDGRNRVVVYGDLLHILPGQFHWQHYSEPLPGALVEVIAEDGVSRHLSRIADLLAQDLARTPYRSEKSLIGQTAHVFQEVALRDAALDDSIMTRTDRTCSELVGLAKTALWPPPDAAAAAQENR
ncbi:MAG TPA: hypothetical protein VNP92_12310 [Actinophytocola sp.]|nr:hypothetical protein [Actinophytocola sp.]